MKVSVNAFPLTGAALDVLMPMHAIISPTGHVVGAGPTLRKLRGENGVVGKRFMELCECHRPRLLRGTYSELSAHSGSPVTLEFRDEPKTRLKGVLLALPGQEGILVNLSFGISVFKAVSEYKLSNSDFAPTDLAIEMLYLQEAKSAVAAELRRVNSHLEWSRDMAAEEAHTDLLTGLGNRRAFERGFASLVKSKADFALIHLDLDHFKQVNDTKGHAAGDEVLRVASHRLLEATRNTDMVVRTGGDEFVILLKMKTDPKTLLKISEKIIHSLEVPILFEGQNCKISGSIGFTFSRYYDEPVVEQMIEDADKALYLAKERGRGCAVAFAPASGEDG